MQMNIYEGSYVWTSEKDMIYSDLIANWIPIGYLSVVYQSVAALQVSSVTEQDRPICGLYIPVTAPFLSDPVQWIILGCFN